jgi:NAD(P)-dependent dehydrogenase (short-subunit alcohol dehydrogenase family)
MHSYFSLEGKTALITGGSRGLGREMALAFNDTGMSPAAPSHEVTEELFDKIVSLNFKGPFRLAALAAHRMRAANGGCIINTSSVASVLPTANSVPYSSAKAALR